MIKNNRIRVFQLGSPSDLYGAERWILALIKHLDPSKVESIVGVIKDEPELDAPLCKLAENLGFQTELIEAQGKINYSAVRKLKKNIIEKRIDILHTHGYKQDIIGLLAKLGTKAKLVTTPHGWSTEGGVKLRAYEIIDRCIFPFFDAVVPLSEGLYNPLKRIPGLSSGKLQVIRNGIDISEIDAVTDIAPELMSWKEQGFFIIGYIGQLIPRKGLDVLLNAVARLDLMNWRLAILGDGEQRAELENLAKNLKVEKQVKFFEFRKDRISFLRGFDLFVLPSRLEGIPRCLMEAMAAGVPAIVSDIPGCQDLVPNNKVGLVFPVNRYEKLAVAIERLAANDSARENAAQNGRELIEKQFSARRMAREYEILFRSLIG